MSGPFFLVPITVTDAMITSSTIAEPAAGEAVWNAATAYAVDDEVIRTSTHRIYTCVVAGTDATPPEESIYKTVPRWVDTRPTDKWAAFDGMTSTQSTIATPMTYVIRPGMINAIAAYGLDGATLSISVKDAPAGTVVYSDTIDLIEPPLDYYDYYFGQIKTLTKVLIKDLVPYADPEITLSITAAGGVTVKAGMIAMGDLRTLVTSGNWGGTESGAKARPITYSYIKTDDFGNTTIVRRSKATDLEITVQLPNSDTDTALATIQEILDIPVACIASDAAGFTGLNTFGLVSGDVSYHGPAHSTIQISVKGLI